MGGQILTQEGFQVCAVTEGGQVQEALARFSPDLVLADVCLPEQSGYQICEKIKNDPALRHVKVVLLVGALEPFDADEARRVGADATIQKPLEPSALMATISPLLSSRSPQPRTRQSRSQDPESLAARTGPEDFALAVEQALEKQEVGRQRVDRERVRAAVVLALESVLPSVLDEVTDRVLAALDWPDRPS